MKDLPKRVNFGLLEACIVDSFLLYRGETGKVLYGSKQFLLVAI